MRPRWRPLAIVLVADLACVAACTPAASPSTGPSGTTGIPSASSPVVATTTPTQTPIPGFERWQLIHPEAVRVSVENGTLVLELTASVLWFNEHRGVLLYREMTGDFRATATIRTSKASDRSVPPGQDGTVQLAGLMVRADEAEENSMFIVSGSIGSSTGLETKTTESDRSIYIQRGLPTGGDAELRLCRIGSTFLLWWRHVDSDEDWTHMSTFDRRDMPETIEIGANIYTDARPDIVARFEHLTIEPLPLGAGC